jgi:cation diffusion facilitator family transporter
MKATGGYRVDERERFRQGAVGAWVGILGNVALAAIKFFVGIIANSRALIADGVHSAADVLGSVAVLIGLRVAKIPADEDHPYGHGKAEVIAAAVVSLFLLVAGVGVGYDAIRAFWEPIAAPGISAMLVAIIAIVVKESMFQYKYRLGKRLESKALIANAYEHRSDVFSSLAALAGIGVAILGPRVGAPILVYFDPLAGTIVALLVMKMGLDIAKESIQTLMDQVLEGEIIEKITRTTLAVDGVERVDEIRAREHGHYIIVDIKISVLPHISVSEGHHIGKMVKSRIMHDFPRVQDVLVHVNPYH